MCKTNNVSDKWCVGQMKVEQMIVGQMISHIIWLLDYVFLWM